MKRIPPGEKIRKEIEEVITRGLEGESVLGVFIERAARLIMQEMLEAEVTEHLGRRHYERRGGQWI